MGKKSDQRKKVNIQRHTVLLVILTSVALAALFIGRWVIAVSSGYFGAFVACDDNMETAVENLKGLPATDGTSETLLPLEQAWDLYQNAHLRDETVITASDGTQLHGYYYDQGSDTTVVVLPRFGQDGTADFLPGSDLAENAGYNLLMPDYRCHGESGGSYFGYGVYEAEDLAEWIQWAKENLHTEQFLIWGTATGANIALYADAEGLLDSSVSMIVAESPYGSMKKLAAKQIFRSYTLPSFPFLTAIEAKLASSDAGYTIHDLELTEKLQNSSTSTPVLFLISSEDSYILPEWSQSVAAAWSGDGETIVAGAEHGTVYADQRQEICSRVTQQMQ